MMIELVFTGLCVGLTSAVANINAEALATRKNQGLYPGRAIQYGRSWPDTKSRPSGKSPATWASTEETQGAGRILGG